MVRTAKSAPYLGNVGIKPFRMESTVSAGFFAFFITMFSTLSLLAVVRLVQWVWGKAES